MDTLPEPDTSSCLAATAMVDCDTPAVRTFAQQRSAGRATALSRAVALYYAVRDDIRYDAYGLDLSVDGLRASTTLAAGMSFLTSFQGAVVSACWFAGVSTCDQISSSAWL